MDDSTYIIPCKSPMCMICVSPIIILEGGNNVNEVISKGVFLQGLEILCKSLNLEDDRFGREEEWTKILGTEGSFVESVCCGKCGEVLRSLVELQELIRKTEVKLKENVIQLELSVVNSVALAAEVEYSISTCMQFREEVLKNYQPETAVPKIVFVSPTPASATSQNEVAKGKSKTRAKQHADVSFPQVKLEELSAKVIPSSVCDEADHEGDDGEEYFPSEDDGDEDFRPYRGSRRRKRGRLQKRRYPNESKSLRSRSRPSKSRQEDDEELVAVLPKRRRGPPPPKAVEENTEETPPADLLMSFEFEGEDEDYSGAEEDESVQVQCDWEEKGTRFSEAESEEEDSNLEEKGKRARARPIKSKPKAPFKDSIQRTCKKVARLLHEDCPFYLKPILDIGDGLLSYFNCRFLLQDNRLICKHPGCNYEYPFENFNTFYAFREMRYHIKMEHRKYKKPNALEADNDKSFYSCVYCDLQFKKSLDMVEHIKTDHPSAKAFPSICEVCGKSLPHSNLLQHIFTHKSEEEKHLAREMQAPRTRTRGPGKGTRTTATNRLIPKIPIFPKDYPCNKCDKVFENLTTWRTHSMIHVPKEARKQFLCDLCPEKLGSLNILRLHMKTVHLKDEQPKPYVCNICGKEFMKVHKTKYEIHMRSHAGERPFQCYQCGRGFWEKYSLKRHELLHLDTQIPCEYCSKIYKSERYLNRHHRKHHPELVPHTDKNLTEKYRKLEHSAEYYGPKLMYPCEPCGKLYIYKSQLVPHLKHAHKIFYEKSSDYPNMLTLEDDVKIKNSRNRGSKSIPSRPHSHSQCSTGSTTSYPSGSGTGGLAEYAHQFQGLGHGAVLFR